LLGNFGDDSNILTIISGRQTGAAHTWGTKCNWQISVQTAGQICNDLKLFNFGGIWGYIVTPKKDRKKKTSLASGNQTWLGNPQYGFEWENHLIDGAFSS
jgi:hypothetical protein